MQQTTLFKMLPQPVQVLPYFGNKWAQTDWQRQIIEYYFSKKTEYHETYCGSASTFFNMAPFAVEGLNDKNPSTVNLFRQIQRMPQQLLEQLNKLPVRATSAELYTLWQMARDSEEDPKADKVFWAAAFLWCAHYEENGGGGRWCHGLSRRIGSRYWQRPDWQRIIEFAHARLENVEISQGDALEYMAKHDGSGVLFYVDPTYLHESERGSKDKRHQNPVTPRRQYAFEMTPEEHENLLDVLNALQAGVILSGYDSAMYATKLKGWVYLKSSSGYSPRERLWVKI